VTKPFLLLATRAEDAAADNEYESFLTHSGLGERDLRRVRLERGPLGHLDLSRWSGVLLGGSPFNSSDPQDTKSAAQLRVERELTDLLDRVIEADFPFLGACYGIGTVGNHQGAVVDRQYGEPVGAVPVSLTDDGERDRLFAVLPSRFEAFVGHKEAVSKLPGHAVLLASSPTCPVQAFRVGENVYATQFHPELDVQGLHTRVEIYKHAGYFPPAEAEAVKAMASAADVRHPHAILPRFVELYAR